MTELANVLGTALLLGGAALVVAGGAPGRGGRVPELGVHRAEAGTRLGGRGSSFFFHATRGVLSVRSADGKVDEELALSVVVNGVARPLAIGHQDLRAAEKGAFAAAIPIALGGEEVGALFDMRIDPKAGALVAELHVLPHGQLLAPHAIALRLEAEAHGRAAFVSGTGELADLGEAKGSAAILDLEPFPIGFTSSLGPIEASTAADDGTRDPHEPLRLAVTSAEATFDGTKTATSELRVVLGPSSAGIYKPLFNTAGLATKKVRGVVTGTTARAQVFGLDGEGLPRVRVRTEDGGRFEVEVPPDVTQWYAAIDPTRTSAPISYAPGTPWDLRLDVSPGGELAVRVTDADTGRPLVARLVVHGVDGTLDPSFGPDYRASGAGPILDTLKGDVLTPLPAGKYRVAATKGIEWSIDATPLEIQPGRSTTAHLQLRHVVPTPGLVGADLHVHARPSFDSPVSVEDRVLSLVAAGVDFAVPSEHNIVGDYGPALDALDLENQLAFVTGVEVTTFNPRFGHFGVFPYPPGSAPPYRATNVNAVFTAAHRDPARALVVNHPRLEQGIGYFDLFGWKPESPTPPPRMRTDFDLVEVYNGYESSRVYKVEAVLRDFYALLNLGHRYAATGSSDSHRIQYQWAGYPRTMVQVGEHAAGDGGKRVEVQAVVAAIKKGRGFVTSGPFIDVQIGPRAARPGDDLETSEDPIRPHVVVRAAPWVDVTSLEVVVGGREVYRTAIEPRPTELGPEAGSLDDAQARTVRFDGELTIPIGPETTWMIVLARGSRAMDDILPFMPITPLAFTNPIWVVRPGHRAPTLPPPHAEHSADQR